MLNNNSCVITNVFINAVIVLHDLHQSKLSLTALSHIHAHTSKPPCTQAEKGRLLTGPRLIRTQFHNFFYCFREQRKRKMCEDHRKEIRKNDLYVKHRKRLHASTRSLWWQPCTGHVTRTPPLPSLHYPLLFVSVTLSDINYGHSWDNNKY